MPCLPVVLLLVAACTRQPQPARIEEITFQSGSFGLVEDLRLPEGSGPFPVVVFVHGDSPADRTFFGMYLPMMERMLRAGFAAFSWDKPGTGESTGQIDSRRVIDQRAQMPDAIEVINSNPDIHAVHVDRRAPGCQIGLKEGSA
jgi:pimeloyl-ACP methyl ester carboxylesterase